MQPCIGGFRVRFGLLSLVRSFYLETGQSEELFFYPALTFLPFCDRSRRSGRRIVDGRYQGRGPDRYFEEASAR